jgi:Fe-S-cluster containining protein
LSLCLACGFCCDGTLFNRVPLQEAEVEPLREALAIPAGRFHGEQPCPALKGTVCGVYGARPLTCRRYRCLLLEAHEADEVGEAEAIAIVETARRARGELARSLGRVDGGLVVEDARRSAASLDATTRGLLDALERQLTFHFLGQRARQR